MPIKDAAFKSLRQSKKHALQNKEVKDNIEYLLRKARRAIEGKKADEAKEFITKAVKAVDKAWQHGVLKRNTASRKKSRIMKAFNALAKK